jgi:hypothetical protein
VSREEAAGPRRPAPPAPAGPAGPVMPDQVTADNADSVCQALEQELSREEQAPRGRGPASPR